MSITQQKFKEIMDVIAKENKLSKDTLFSQIADLYQPSSPWGSKSAKDLATDKKVVISSITGTGKEGKILLADVQKAVGMNVVKKISLHPFVSQKARDLAKEHGLTKNTKASFPMNSRTGINKKNGKQEKITLSDVRKVAELGKDNKIVLFASKEANALALKYKIDPVKINGTGKSGKIKKSDIENYNNKKSNKSSKEQEDIPEIIEDEIIEVDSDVEN